MKKSVFLILTLFFVSTLNIGYTASAQENVDYIIVYDEAHLQFFTHDLLNTGLSALNETFDTSSSDITVRLVLNQENFTHSNLQGSDLVIVPSPNFKSDGTSNIGSDEKEALTDYVQNGGSIFYMANPYSNHANLTGHYTLMTQILPNGFGANIRLGSGEDETTVIVDDFYNDGNNTHVYFTDAQIQSDTWKNELNSVSSVIYYGASINDQVGNNPFYGNATTLTYSVNKDYQAFADDLGNIKWLVGGTIGENDGRVVLIGSTIMFADYPYDNETNWIDVEDNQALFENLAAWLLKITPLNVPEDTINRPFDYFLTRNVLYGVLISIGLVILAFGILLRTNTITLDRIFDFRIKKKDGSKEKTTKKTTKKGTRKAKKKTTKKRRKRT